MKWLKVAKRLIRGQNPADDVVIAYNSNGSLGLVVKSMDRCPIVVGQWYRDLFSGRIVRVDGVGCDKVYLDGRSYGVNKRLFKAFYRMEMEHV